MAFTGTPILRKVTDRCFRITGVHLAAGASGTIGFTDKTVPAEISLDAPNWEPYRDDGEAVSLQDLVIVNFNKVNNPFAETPPNQVVIVTKTGTTHADFAVTLTNTALQRTSDLEIYLWKS